MLDIYDPEDTGCFCPYINYNKRDFMPRRAPSSKTKITKDGSECCATYKWWQTDESISIQYCLLKNIPETNLEKCEMKFNTCPLYRKDKGLPLTESQIKELEMISKNNTTKKLVRRKA
jgi:hypothetical protein